MFSALNTFFNYSEQASQHKTAAALYEALRRRLDMFVLRSKETKNIDEGTSSKALDELNEVATAFDELAGRCPTILDTVYDQVALGQRRREADRELYNAQAAAPDHPPVQVEHE